MKEQQAREEIAQQKEELERRMIEYQEEASRAKEALVKKFPKGDQYQFSPNRVNTPSRETVVRIGKMITKEKMRRSFIKFS